jgi:hypothetical protein
MWRRSQYLIAVLLVFTVVAPVYAHDGLLGMNAATPVSIRIVATSLTSLDTLGVPDAGLLDMERVPMSHLLVTQVPLIGADAGLSSLETVGMEAGSSGQSGLSDSHGTSDPWVNLKLDKNPDYVGRRIGIGFLLPDVTISSGYNDNLTTDPNNIIDTFYTRIEPHSSYIIGDRVHRIDLDLLLDAGFYEASSKDNYVDHRWRASYDYNPTSRIFASAFAEYLGSHDGRGRGRAEGGPGITQNTLDEWHRWGLGGQFAYGAQSAQGRLEFEASYLDKTYDTNRAFTFSRDLEEYKGTARFFYRIRPKTFLVFEGTAIEHDYTRDVVGTPTLDGTTTSFLTGVTWRATYKTTGFAKIGYNFRTFDSDQRNSESGLDWEIGMDWKPRSYSTVHLESSSTIAESNGTGNAINQSNILLSWQHYWRERFNTRLELGYQNSTFDPDPREDNGYLMGIRANYAFRRWLNLSTGFRHTTLDSTDAVFGYDQNIVDVTVDLVF